MAHKFQNKMTDRWFIRLLQYLIFLTVASFETLLTKWPFNENMLTKRFVGEVTFN